MNFSLWNTLYGCTMVFKHIARQRNASTNSQNAKMNEYKEENTHFSTVLTTYDSSNDWAIGSCVTVGGWKNCKTNWLSMSAKEWWGAWKDSTHFWSKVEVASILWEPNITINVGWNVSTSWGSCNT